jgi:hypothetical protein
MTTTQYDVAMVRSPTPSTSGSVFAELGIPEPDVELAKADLAIRIHRLAEHRRFTSDEAAVLLKVPKSELPALFRAGCRRVHSTSCCGC